MASALEDSVWVVLYRPSPDAPWQAWGDVAWSRREADYIVNVAIPHRFNDGLMERKVVEVVLTAEAPHG